MTKFWTDDLGYINYVLGRALAGRRELLEDFKGPAIFLASRASDIVTGVSLVLDGGLIAKREPIKTHGCPYITAVAEISVKTVQAQSAASHPTKNLHVGLCHLF
jgi:hypothetical protein